MESLIGKTEEDAVKEIEAAGFLSRVKWRNDTSLKVAKDLRSDRVNLYIKNRKVLVATIG